MGYTVGRDRVLSRATPTSGLLQTVGPLRRCSRNSCGGFPKAPESNAKVARLEGLLFCCVLRPADSCRGSLVLTCRTIYCTLSDELVQVLVVQKRRNGPCPRRLVALGCRNFSGANFALSGEDLRARVVDAGLGRR